MGWTFFVLIFLLSLESWASDLEACRSQDLAACARVGDEYFQKSDWVNAFAIHEALCQKELSRSCQVAGASLLALGKVQEGHKYLSRACDQYEALACRSLARLMEKAQEKELALMYKKLSCHFGLSELCEEAQAKLDYAPAASTWLEVLPIECRETQTTSCQEHLQKLQACAAPFTPRDCKLLSGHLSVFMRAKLLQAEAKVLLMALASYQLSLKEDKNFRRFSYDLPTVQKRAQALKNYHYVFGFKRVCSKQYVRARHPRYHSQKLYPESYRQFPARELANVLSFFEQKKNVSCPRPQEGYEAFAVSALDPLHPSQLDVWKIDQTQKLVHWQDGSPAP